MMRDRALGRDRSEVAEDDEVKSVSNEVTYAHDLETREDIEAALSTISAKVGRRLRRKGLKGRTVAVKMRYDNRTTRSAQCALAVPTDDDIAFAPVVHRLAEELWRSGHEGAPARCGRDPFRGGRRPGAGDALRHCRPRRRRPRRARPEARRSSATRRSAAAFWPPPTLCRSASATAPCASASSCANPATPPAPPRKTSRTTSSSLPAGPSCSRVFRKLTSKCHFEPVLAPRDAGSVEARNGTKCHLRPEMAMGGLPFRGRSGIHCIPLKRKISAKTGPRETSLAESTRAEQVKRGAIMALVLAIDIRNTRTRIGLAVDGRLVSQWAVPTDSAETADGAVACVLGFFDALARNLAPIEKDADAIDLPESAPLADGAIIASVIPALTGVWSDAARRLTDARPLTVGPGLKTGLKMNFSDPTAVGADRVAPDGGRQEHLRRSGPRHRSGHLHHLRTFGRDGRLPRRHHRPGHEARRPGAGPPGPPSWPPWSCGPPNRCSAAPRPRPCRRASSWERWPASTGSST